MCWQYGLRRYKKKKRNKENTKVLEYPIVITLLVHLLNLRRRSIVMRNDAIVIGDNEHRCSKVCDPIA